MTEPWADVRELIRQSRPIPDSLALPLLTDAVLLLAMRDALKVIDIALTKGRAYAHIGRLVSDALAALPEHLK